MPNVKMQSMPDPADSLVASEQISLTLHPRRWLILCIVVTAAFLPVMDYSILNVSIPAIQHDLRANFAQIQFVVTGYGLPYAIFLITGGRLGDIIGRKRMFMLGMSGFALASALCGLAQNPDVLIWSRVLQGFMSALMYPQVLALIRVTFPTHERSKAFAILGIALGIAFGTGQLVGGLFIQANLFGLLWRPIFLVNLPISLGALLTGGAFITESRPTNAPKLDLVGVAIASLGLLLLIYPCIAGREAGWPLWTYGSIIASVIVLALFVRYERWKTAYDDSPLIRLHLFHEGPFVIGLLMTLCLYSEFGGFVLALAFYQQSSLQYSALEAGLTLLPFAVGFLATSILSARIAPLLGARLLQLGAGIMSAAQAGLILCLLAQGGDIASPLLLLLMLVLGIGQGLLQAPLMNMVLSALPASMPSSDVGSASGVLTTMQQVGLSIGTAFIGTIFFSLLGTHLDRLHFMGAFAVALSLCLALMITACVLAGLLIRGRKTVII